MMKVGLFRLSWAYLWFLSISERTYIALMMQADSFTFGMLIVWTHTRHGETERKEEKRGKDRRKKGAGVVYGADAGRKCKTIDGLLWNPAGKRVCPLSSDNVYVHKYICSVRVGDPSAIVRSSKIDQKCCAFLQVKSEVVQKAASDMLSWCHVTILSPLRCFGASRCAPVRTLEDKNPVVYLWPESAGVAHPRCMETFTENGG